MPAGATALEKTPLTASFPARRVHLAARAGEHGAGRIAGIKGGWAAYSR